MESIRWQFYPYVAENPHGRSRLETTEHLLCREGWADTREMRTPCQAPDPAPCPPLSSLHVGGQGLLAFAHSTAFDQQALWARQEGTRPVGRGVHGRAGRRRSRIAGCPSSVSIPLSSKFTVVSWPANSSSAAVANR